jgi:hypothetical protein
MPDIDACRAEGLRLAVELHSRQDFGTAAYGGDTAGKILADAAQFATWLESRPDHLRLTPAQTTYQQPGFPGPAVPTQTGDNGMSVTMTDAQQVSYSVEPEDSKGIAVSDTLTWSSDDGGAVVTVTPSADTLSCVFAAVAPGTANISVTDGTLTDVDVITVVAGGVATLVLTPGTPVAEPAPAV